ncbi:MAG: monovalent cation:proton antiporter-2 (CPA2) family protein [Pseudomonadota bacterium]
MNGAGFFVEATIYLAAAVIAVPLCKRLGLGPVLGYLLAGIVIGPNALQLIAEPERVLHFAEFGVVLLLFLVGLELEPQQVWRMRKALLGLGGMQVLITVAVVYGIALLFGLSWPVALVIGMGFAMSSTAIGLASLEERKLFNTAGGQASFAVLLLQDLSVIPLFMVLALLAPDGPSGINGWLALKALLVVAVIVIASRTILRPVMRVVAQTGMREIFVAFSLLLVTGVSLAVQSVGLSMALGTFLAGVLLADSEYRYELRLDIEPVKGLLLGLFFIAVGMSVDLSLIASAPVKIIGLALAVVAVKACILFGLGRLFKLSYGDAGLFAIGLSQIGEFAFVIFGIGLSQNTLNVDQYNMLNAIVAISMLITPLLLVIYDKYSTRRLRPAASEKIEEKNPVIIAGFGRFGQMIVRVLNAQEIPITVIDRDPNQVELMRSFGWNCYYGDASRLDLLLQAGIEKACLFVIAIDDPVAAVATARLVRARWPQLPVIVRARSRTDAFDFRELGLDPIRETFYSSLHAAGQALQALGQSESAAQRIIQRFEEHDRDQLERALKVRHDRKAVMSIAQQGRRDLQALLATERGTGLNDADQSGAQSGPYDLNNGERRRLNRRQ